VVEEGQVVGKDRDVEFERSSFCRVGTCVEVALGAEGVASIRDSKRPGRQLSFSSAEWADFVRGVKAGEFDVE
jgi:hypothetical protein